MKPSHAFYVAAAVVLIADIISGYQTASSATQTAPTWYADTLGKVESANPLPIPLWAMLAGTGVALHYAMGK